jgi:hypothetical protein
MFLRLLVISVQLPLPPSAELVLTLPAPDDVPLPVAPDDALPDEEPLEVDSPPSDKPPPSDESDWIGMTQPPVKTASTVPPALASALNFTNDSTEDY